MSQFTPFRARPKRPRPVTATSTLGVSDFTYLGAFALPPEFPGGSSAAFKWMGLTGRRVGGTLGLFVCANNNVGEITTIPTLTTAAPYNQASIANTWAVSFPTDPDGSTYDSPFLQSVLHIGWDPVDERLYYTTGGMYQASGHNYRSVGYVTLSGGGSYTAYGPWRTQTPAMQRRDGITFAPQGWADSYTGGKRLLLGAGGYWSTIQSCSQGPVCAATEHPSAGLSTSTTLTAQNVINHALGTYGGAGKTNVLARRTGDATPDVDDTDTMNYTAVAEGPGALQGYWQWWDTASCMCWVDTGTKSGLIYAGQEGTGDIYYSGGGRSDGGWYSYLRVYSLADVTAAAAGSVQPYSLLPSAYFRTSAMSGALPSRFTQAWTAWNDNMNHPMVQGLWFDATTNKLYMLHRILDTAYSVFEPRALVLVFQLP
jgi:hypothetical protein